ncbi:MAG TPA: hypothetical protein PJ988_02365 [Anaerolinea sp.]|nr:hypothetical protein [Anaerolinea sp.]
MLDREPQVGPVSWTIPISQALQTGGLHAAYDCCEEIKEDGGAGYLFDAYELIPLVYQLVSVGKMDLAVEVLKLDLHAFPDHVETHQILARLIAKYMNDRQI